jgi:hypothetical protein
VAAPDFADFTEHHRDLFLVGEFLGFRQVAGQVSLGEDTPRFQASFKTFTPKTQSELVWVRC